MHLRLPAGRRFLHVAGGCSLIASSAAVFRGGLPAVVPSPEWVAGACLFLSFWGSVLVDFGQSIWAHVIQISFSQMLCTLSDHFGFRPTVPLGLLGLLGCNVFFLLPINGLYCLFRLMVRQKFPS